MPFRAALTHCSCRRPHNRIPWLVVIVCMFLVLSGATWCLLRIHQQEDEEISEYSIEQVLSVDEDGSAYASLEPGSYTTSYGEVVIQHEEDDIVQVVSSLLSSYQAAAEADLVYATYLDLFGNVWAGVLRSDTWVEICLVMERDTNCELRIVHLDAEQIQALEEDGSWLL